MIERDSEVILENNIIERVKYLFSMWSDNENMLQGFKLKDVECSLDGLQDNLSKEKAQHDSSSQVVRMLYMHVCVREWVEERDPQGKVLRDSL